MSAEMPRYFKKIEQKISDEIFEMFHSKVKVSIQLPSSHQGKERDPPDAEAELCCKAFADEQSRTWCDRSDWVMKRKAKQLSKSLKDPVSVAYRCHMGLSNIVIPFYDKQFSHQLWFVFIGQFELCSFVKCCTTECSIPEPYCTGCLALLNKYNTVVLSRSMLDTLADEEQKTVLEGVLCSEPHRAVNELDIPALIGARALARKHMTAFFRKPTPRDKEFILDFKKRFSRWDADFWEDYPKLRLPPN